MGAAEAEGAANAAAPGAAGRTATPKPATRSVDVVGAGDAMQAVDVLLADAWRLTGRSFDVHNNL